MQTTRAHRPTIIRPAAPILFSQQALRYQKRIKIRGREGGPDTKPTPLRFPLPCGQRVSRYLAEPSLFSEKQAIPEIVRRPLWIPPPARLKLERRHSRSPVAPKVWASEARKRARKRGHSTFYASWVVPADAARIRGPNARRSAPSNVCRRKERHEQCCDVTPLLRSRSEPR
jgi:hypothetical protein